jgi:two-component system response regulator YesN
MNIVLEAYMKITFFKSKIKFRIVVTLLLLGIIPTMILGVFSYNKSSKIIQKKVDEANMNLLSQTKLSVEKLLLTADIMMLQFTQSPTIKESIDIEIKGSNFSSFNKIENVINSLPTSNFGANGIDFVNFNKNWVVSNSGIYKLEDHQRMNEFLMYLNMKEDSIWIDKLSSINKDFSNDLQPMDGVKLIKKLSLFSGSPSGVAILNIPYSFLNTLVPINNSSSEIMIVSSDGCILANKDALALGMDISAFEYIQKIKTSETASGNFTVSIDKNPYSINFIKSKYNGWIYLYKTSVKTFTKDSRSIGWFTFLTCLIVFLLITVVTFFISNKLYNPIKKLSNLFIEINESDVIEKKQDELSFIEKNISFLVKEQDKLKKQVYSQWHQLKDFFILKLLLGQMDSDVIKHRIELFNYPASPNYMRVLVLRIDTLSETQFKENELDLALFAVNNIIEEMLQSIILLSPLVIDDHQVTVISEHDCTDKNIIYSTAKNIQDTIWNVLKLSVSFGVSTTVNSYNELHKAFDEGLDSLRYQIALDYKAIMFIEDLQIKNSCKPLFPFEVEEELLSAVKLCDEVKSKELLHKFIDRVINVDSSIYEYQASFIRLLTDLVFLLKSSGQSYHILIKKEKSVFEELLKLKTSTEIENWFFSCIITPIIQTVDSKEKNHYSKIVEDILNIIHQRYSTDLTLEECSTLLNYHPSYLRRILKNECGITFSQYLAQYRMDMALKWLTETDMKICDIATKLSYKNTENFIRNFKKVTCMTPGQYRENITASKHIE